MEQKSMTALVSAFSRAYHYENNKIMIFGDSVARRLLLEREYEEIGKNMSRGIAFFNLGFNGTDEEALRWVVDNQLSPSPLGRAAFTEKMLQNSVMTGAEQYLIFGAGYDTFAYRQPEWATKLHIFEIDHPLTGSDKQERLRKANINIPENISYIAADFTETHWIDALRADSAFDEDKLSFCSMQGLSYYLSPEAFKGLIATISEVLPEGSAIVFDYPDEKSYTAEAGDRAKKQAMLAGAAKEKMLASYSYKAIEQLLSDQDMLIYEHLTPEEITEQYFAEYNKANPPHHMTAFDNVNYCLTVKKKMLRD